MAARATIHPIYGFEDMAGATNADILKWLTDFEGRNDKRLTDLQNGVEKNNANVSALNGIVAGLSVRVETVQTQVISLGSQVDSKVSRPELDGAVLRFKEDLIRIETDVDKDVDSFKNMYDSVVDELSSFRDKIDPALRKLDSIDERLKKLEPLDAEAKEAKGFLHGATWAAHTLYVLVGALLGAGIVRVIFK